jgi:SAM-dependent methyltransferase
MRIVSKLRRSMRRGGWRETRRLILINVRELIRRHPQSSPNASPDLFDIEHDVDTGNLVEQHDLDAGPNRIFAIHYEPTPVAQFRLMMAGIDVAHQEYTFIDFGSGKGRTLLLAAEYPFAAVLGVEFSQELHRIANANIEKCRRQLSGCRDVHSVCADAAVFPLPPGPLFLYFYHPFEKPVMESVVQNIRRDFVRNPRPIVVLYYNPVCASIWERDGLFESDCRAEDFIVYRSNQNAMLHLEE